MIQNFTSQFLYRLKELQKAVKIKYMYHTFPTGKVATILAKIVMSHHLFWVIQASFINEIHYILSANQNKMYIYQVLMNSESDNMGLVSIILIHNIQ
jgi:hypothetical protein